MTLILSGTDGLSDVDGSAATPAIRGTDANTGIFFPAADTIAFSEGGTEVARFNANAQFVAAAGTASLPVITTTGDTNTGIFFPAADTIAFSEGGVEAMRIDSSGNVGIGLASTGDTLLEIYGANSATTYKNVNTGTGSSDGFYVGMAKSSGTDGYVYNRESANVIFGTANAERMRIDTSGNLLVGKTAQSPTTAGIEFVPPAVSGSGITVTSAQSSNLYSGFQMYSTGAAAYRFYVTFDGKINATFTTITAIASDVRLKQDIVDYDKGLEEVLALQPRYFAYKNEPDKKLSGFIAQEVQTVIPEAIQPTLQDPEMFTYSIDWYPLLVKAIQEQQAIITQLQADVAALKGTA